MITQELNNIKESAISDMVPATEDVFNEIQHSITADNQPKANVVLEQYQELYTLNKDLIGWFESDGLGISYPVLQNLEEEDFYLSHNFYKESEQKGTLFIDATASILPRSRNIVIYGHNMNSGDMFGNLDKYNDKEFYFKYPTFTFDTIYETGTYHIVAVIKTRILKTEEEGFRYYQFYDYSNEEEFEEFESFIEDSKLYETEEHISYGDSFVMLSTCEYSTDEGRLLIIGKKE